MSRALAIAAASALIVLALLDYNRFATGQERAMELARLHGLDDRHPGLGGEVSRHYDPVLAELRVARALLNDELDRGWMSGLPAAQQRLEAERGMARLREARALAASAWPRRLTSWEAALVLGGATYLELYRARDSNLMAGFELWEKPLLAAHRLGPSQTGPVRFLAAAYLGNWSSLSSEQRRAAIELMTVGFQDRRTFTLLIQDWLRVAPSRSQALALVPDRPWAWETLQRIFASAGDLELEVAARRRRHASLESDQHRVIAEARTALREGDQRRARHTLLTLLERLPRSLDFAPALAQILELLPPGPTGSRHAAAFAGWLAWTFDACTLGGCPFEERALSRLALLSGDLPPEQRALAFLIAGDLPQAQFVERRFAQTSRDAWARYYLLKAEHLARAGRIREAIDSLAHLPGAWRSRPRYWLARRQIAELDEDAAAAAESSSALARLRRSAWARTDWQRHESTARLELLPQSDAAGLRIEIADAAARGAVFDVLWDGELVAILRTSGPQASFELDLAVASGLHRLELVFHSGGSARPATVDLIPSVVERPMI